MLGIQTSGRRMVGADETMELWRLPSSKMSCPCLFVCLFASFCITLTVLSSFRRSTRAPRSCPSRLATTRRGPSSTEGRKTLPRMRIWQFRLVVLYSFSAANKAGVLKKHKKYIICIEVT